MSYRLDQQLALEDAQDAQRFGYGWASLRPTHPAVPNYLWRAQEAERLAWEAFDAVVEEILAVPSDEQMFDRYMVLRDKRDKTHNRWLRLSKKLQERQRRWNDRELAEWGGM